MIIKEDEIDNAFDAKKDCIIELKDAQDIVNEAERDKIKRLREIAKHDQLMRDQGTLDKLIIKGKNVDERNQCEKIVLEKQDLAINMARDLLAIKKLDNELADLEIKQIDYQLRNAGV